MGSIIFHVDGVPIGKGRARATTINGHARLYTPAKTRAYEARVAEAGKTAMDGAPPFLGAVALHCDVAFEPPASWSRRKRADALNGDILPTGRPDSDNCLKAISDGLNGIAYRDDAQICELTVRKHYSRTAGVTIRVIAL